jgi:hypothetical protein
MIDMYKNSTQYEALKPEDIRKHNWAQCIGRIHQASKFYLERKLYLFLLRNNVLL